MNIQSTDESVKIATESLGQPQPWQMGFQEAASPVMEGLHDMHSLLMYIITGVAVVVFLLLSYIFYKFRQSKNPIPSTFTHNTTLEIIWTTLPIIILVIIGIPSIRLLQKMETPPNAGITIKAVGHQWYWSYEYPDSKNEGKHFEFDSYMIEDKDLKPGQLRLLDVANGSTNRYGRSCANYSGRCFTQLCCTITWYKARCGTWKG